MNTLQIIDVSAVVHTAEHVESFEQRSYYNYPVGGIHLLMRYVTIAFSLRDDVILCFDSPCFRKNLCKDYKAGRAKNQRVISQLESVYEGLSSCGIQCLKVDGYEADDLIHWAVDEFVDRYEEIVIIGNDYDLCHEVRAKVKFKTINQNMNNIYVGNFETSIKRGERIVFNTISAYKVFCGCSSDGIPALKVVNGKSGKQLYKDFISFLSQNNVPLSYSSTTSPKLLRIFAKYNEEFNQNDREEIDNRIELIYPADRPANLEISPVSYRNIDKDKFIRFLTFYNDKDSIRCLGGNASYLTEDDKQNLRNKARMLSSGEYAADHDIEQAANIKTSTLQLDSFTRDFA